MTEQIVLDLHGMALRKFGGAAGVRDPHLVQSAVAAALNVFLYETGDLFTVAAAYAFHLAQAQAFLDGNKRTAVAAALVFLELNGVTEIPDDAQLEAGVMAIAKRRLDRAGLAEVLRGSRRMGES